MNLTEFFSIIQKYGDGSFSFPVLKDFLTTPNTPNLTNFFDLYKQDKRLASAVDSKKYAKVIGKILEDHKAYGGDPQTITSALQKNPNKMTISSMDIRNVNIPSERMHKFTINVSGTLLYDVVEKIYDFSKESNYDLDMEIPAAKDQKLGLTDTIVLYSSNNNLFNTLDFIQKLKTISNNFGDQPKYREDGETRSYYAEISEGIAYDSYNSEHEKWNRDIVGETIIEAIDNMIVNFVADNFELYGNADYVNYKNDRKKFIRDMMDQGLDVYGIFNSYLEDGLRAKNVDPDNIYLSENVYEKFLGPKIKVTEAVEDNLEDQMDLADAIERKTAELLGQSKENGQGGEPSSEEEKESESYGDGTNLDEFNLLGEGGDEFTPLVSQVERVNPESAKVLGLNPENLPLNPLDYLTRPAPTANLRHLDELTSGKEITSDLEDETLKVEGQIEGKETEVFFDEGTLEENSGGAEELNPDEVFVGEQQKFGSNITVPSEEETLVKDGLKPAAGSGEGEVAPVIQPEEVIDGPVIEEQGTEEQGIEDQIASEQVVEGTPVDEQLESNTGSLFGPTFLQDLMNEYAESVKEGGEGDIISDEQPGEEVVGNNGLSDKDVIEARQVDEKSPASQTEQEKEENPTMDLLREYRERRAAEMAEMQDEENALMQLMGTSISDRKTKEVPKEVNPGEEYLEELLRMSQSGKGNLEEDKLEHGENVSNDSLDSSKGSTAVAVRSASIPQSEAEKYLDAVLAAATSNSNNSAFAGFDMGMLDIENNAGELGTDLTPSAVFAENVSKVEEREKAKSPAEKRIEAMLAALDERKNNQSSIQMGDMPKTTYHHVTTEQEEALEKLLRDAMETPPRSDFNGFNEDMFDVTNAQGTANGTSEMFESSLANVSKADMPKKATNKEEERFDAMLRGDFQPPAVVIEAPAPVTVVQKVSEEDQRLTKMLENLGKDTPAVAGVEEHVERPVYHPVVSDKEQELEALLKKAETQTEPVLGSIREEMIGAREISHEPSENEAYLQKLLDAVENQQEGEFTGFNAEDIADQTNYLDVASTPQELFAMTVQEGADKNKVQEKVTVVNEQEAHLNSLLNNLTEQKEGEQVLETEETALNLPSTYVHVPTDEEIRLAELERAALEPQPRIVEDTKEEKSTEVGREVPKEEMSESESYLEHLLNMTSGENVEQAEEETFTGFDEEMVGGTAIEMAGPQGLINTSLEEKIQQVYAIEQNKNPEERRMDLMLRGVSNGESAAEDISTTQTSQDKKDNPQGTSLTSLFDDLEKLPSLEGDAEFTGFDETMLGSDGSEVVKTAQDLFSEEVKSSVLKIEDATTARNEHEQHLNDLLKLVEEVNKVEVVGDSEALVDAIEAASEQIPAEKGGNELDPESEAFTGFGTEEIFFDEEEEPNEEKSLADAMASVTFRTLNSADALMQEERDNLLNGNIPQEYRISIYRFLFGDKTEEIMNTIVAYEDGREISILDYLEENNVLTLLPDDTTLIVNGESITRDEFICNLLIPDLISNGCVSLFDYINQKEIDIELPKPSGGLFKL